MAQYAALTAALGGIAETNGQVVYTDITDEAGNRTSAYDFNLDGDGTVDFQIFGYNGSQILVDGNSSGNSVAGVFTADSYAYPFALNEGAVIDADQACQAENRYGQILRFVNPDGDSCGFASNWCSQDGDDDDTVDKYLGFRFKIGTAKHYGWARLDIIGTITLGSWLIKDFADEATPDTPIADGAGILGVDDLDVISKVNIVVTDNQIQLYRLPETTNYKLYSITGQEVLKGSTSSNRSDIETNGLTHGIYILEIEDANTTTVFRKKVVLR